MREFVQSGDVARATREYRQAMRLGMFNVSSHLPIQVRREDERAKKIFKDWAKQIMSF